MWLSNGYGYVIIKYFHTAGSFNVIVSVILNMKKTENTFIFWDLHLQGRQVRLFVIFAEVGQGGGALGIWGSSISRKRTVGGLNTRFLSVFSPETSYGFSRF